MVQVATLPQSTWQSPGPAHSNATVSALPPLARQVAPAAQSMRTSAAPATSMRHVEPAVQIGAQELALQATLQSLVQVQLGLHPPPASRPVLPASDAPESAPASGPPSGKPPSSRPASCRPASRAPASGSGSPGVLASGSPGPVS